MYKRSLQRLLRLNPRLSRDRRQYDLIAHDHNQTHNTDDQTQQRKRLKLGPPRRDSKLLQKRLVLKSRRRGRLEHTYTDVKLDS
jgi:hypothetical protein